MRTLFNTLVIVSMAVLLAGCAAPSFSDGMTNAARQTAVKTAVDARQYSFKAMTAATQKGRNINLTSAYGIVVKPDMLSCDLPFFGTSFGGSAYGGEGAIRFESKQFEYSAEPGKKNGWTVTIVPKDNPEVQKIMMMIGAEGYTTVTVISTNRSAMNYYGNLEWK